MNFTGVGVDSLHALNHSFESFCTSPIRGEERGDFLPPFLLPIGTSTEVLHIYNCTSDFIRVILDG